MPTTRKRAVPLGVPTLLGVAGLAAVVAVGPQAWQLVVSVILAAVLVVVDVQRYLRGM